MATELTYLSIEMIVKTDREGKEDNWRFDWLAIELTYLSIEMMVKTVIVIRSPVRPFVNPQKDMVIHDRAIIPYLIVINTVKKVKIPDWLFLVRVVSG